MYQTPDNGPRYELFPIEILDEPAHQAPAITFPSLESKTYVLNGFRGPSACQLPATGDTFAVRDTEYLTDSEHARQLATAVSRGKDYRVVA
jgi:hypothetical protein